MRVALFREHRSQGTTSILWGLGFALFLWAGLEALGLHEGRAIAFALVAGTAIALFIYLRGAALENPPIGQPGVFHRRLLAYWRSTPASSVPPQPYAMNTRALLHARVAPADQPQATKTRELLQARVALDNGELGTALFLLQQTRRVAVAQRKPEELLEVYELVRALSERSGGRIHAASERLARKVEAGLRSFARPGSI